MPDFIYESATTLARVIREGAAGSREVVQAHLDRITERDDVLNAITDRLDDEALAAAAQADRDLARGIVHGPLHGVPVTVKECLSLAGKPTTCGSPLLQHHVPEADATAVARLKAAGAIPIARTNLPEWALDYQSDNQLFGRTNNPWKLDRSCGGSSGGEGAAIAAGMSPFGLGSDVGGSIRIPAHFCGICGVKPTAGRVPCTGHVPEGLYDYEQIGPLARDIDDLELALRVISGPDGNDPATQPVPYSRPRHHDLRTMRVAFMLGDGVNLFSRDTQTTVRNAATMAEELGAEVSEAMPPHLESIFETMLPLYSLDLQPLHDAMWKDNLDQLHPQLHGIIELLNPEARLQDVVEATIRLRGLRRGAMHFFQRYDVLLCPATAVPAIPHGVRETNDVDGEAVPYFMIGTLMFMWNLCGNPAVVIPMGMSADGLPIGIQVVGRHWDEATAFMVAKQLLAAAGGVPRPAGY